MSLHHFQFDSKNDSYVCLKCGLSGLSPLEREGCSGSEQPLIGSGSLQTGTTAISQYKAQSAIHEGRSLALEAMRFAFDKHRDQTRKYTGNPYTDHLAEVAGIVGAVDPDQRTIATAWLHDVVEDQDVSLDQITALFGYRVSEGVYLLTDWPDPCKSRFTRKAESAARLSQAPAWVQNIKAADIISNTGSIVRHDPTFADVYLKEKAVLMEAMMEVHPLLRSLVMEIIHE